MLIIGGQLGPKQGGQLQPKTGGQFHRNFQNMRNMKNVPISQFANDNCWRLYILI